MGGMPRLRSESIAVLALLLVACGGDDDAGGGSESKPSCAFGATLSGDVLGTFDANKDLACLISHSFESGIDVVFITGEGASTVELGIDDVTEGQTGTAFPATIRLSLEDGGDYATPTGGCTATVTEHQLEKTEMSAIGELRHYQVAGAAVCAEPAISSAPETGAITFDDVTFRIPAVWRD